MTLPSRVAVLGAGPAGLGAAYQLARRKLAQVTVLERSTTVGGNAGSFELGGLRVDYGSHRLHPNCDPDILEDIRSLLGEDLLERPRHGRIRLRRRWVPFPLKPLDLFRSLPLRFACGIAFDALRTVVRSAQRHRETESFRSVLEDNLGTTICRDFYFPYARKIWGVEPEQLSAVQARRRVQATSLGGLLRRVLCAASKSKHRGNKRFYYPRRGYGQISQAYFEAAREQGVQFLFDATAQVINVSSGKVNSIQYETAGRRLMLDTDHVWSTIPITALVDCLRPAAPAEVVRASHQISFRGMILIYLVVAQRRFSEFDAHYFPELDVSISRLSEPRNYSGTAEPSDRTVLCAELPCDRDDPAWQMPDQQLGQLVVDTLAHLGIPISAPVEQVATRRLPQAYPVYEKGYEVHFGRMDNWLATIPNLLTFGRQGLFAHDNMHHALSMAYSAADCLKQTGEFDATRWQQYRKAFSSYVVED